MVWKLDGVQGPHWARDSSLCLFLNVAVMALLDSAVIWAQWLVAASPLWYVQRRVAEQLHEVWV